MMLDSREGKCKGDVPILGIVTGTYCRAYVSTKKSIGGQRLTSGNLVSLLATVTGRGTR